MLWCRFRKGVHEKATNVGNWRFNHQYVLTLRGINQTGFLRREGGFLSNSPQRSLETRYKHSQGMHHYPWKFIPWATFIP